MSGRAFLLLALALGQGACSALPPIEMLVPPGKDKEVDAGVRRAHYEESAQTFYDGGRYQQAVGQWKRVLELDPASQKAKWGLAKSYAMIGNPQALLQAEVLFVELMPQTFVHPTRGDIHFEIERDLAEVYLGLAEWQDGAYRANKAKVDAAGKEGKPPLAAPAEAELQRAMTDQRSKRDDYLRRAIPLYEGVLQKSPENPYALAGLAKSHLTLGDDRTGIDYALRYVALSHRNQEQWHSELRELERRMGKATDQEREFFLGRIRGALDKEVGMRLLVGSVMIRDGRHAEAIEQYTEVLRRDPARLAAYLERGQAFAMTGKYRRAVRDLEEYMKITDPVKHHGPRISAFELLEKYRVIAAGEPKIETEDIDPYKTPEPLYKPVQIPDQLPPPPPEEPQGPPPPDKRRYRAP